MPDLLRRARFYAYYRRQTPIGYANSLRTLLAMDHITSELPKITVPVLLIGGDRDPSLGPMRTMQGKIRGSKLIVLSPASHFANRDQPEAWNRAATDFLARVDARRRLSCSWRAGRAGGPGPRGPANRAAS
jgi:pimeloyl-ACP methyl ester carboxylesterase